MQLFNDFADQANYYDICLLIFHAANHHNTRIIAETWDNLIASVHFDVVQRQQIWNDHRAGKPLPADVEVPTAPPPHPYEMVSSSVETIAHRTSLDSLIFPVDTLLPSICKYAISEGQDASIGADPAWPVQLFLGLGVSHNIIVKVLEQIFDTQEAPFTGRRRKSVVLWIDVVADAWLSECERRGGNGGKGEGALGTWVAELLGRCAECLAMISAAGVRGQTEAEEVNDLRRKTLMLQTAIVRYAKSANMTSSLFG